MSSVKDIVLRHDKYVTATVNAYTTRLEDIVATATARTIADLQGNLDILQDGSVANTAANQRVLRGLDSIFEDEMDAAGFASLNTSYAAQFPGQLTFLDEIIDKIGAELAKPLPGVKDAIRAEDKRVLASQQASAVSNLDTVVDMVAATAKRQVLMSVAGLSAKDLAATLATAFKRTVGQAESIADTAQVVFYRTVSERAFAVIEEDLPGFSIRYEYEGPDDRITRAFCVHLLRAAKTYTRDEISKMDNGQFPVGTVLTTGGGWNCRHSFVIAL